MARRVIRLHGGLNLRDLGGYPTCNGDRTQWGRVLRGGSTARLGPYGVAALVRRGVRTVIDLRTEQEWVTASSALAGQEDVTLLHCPVYGDGEAWAPDDYRATGTVYVFWLEERADRLAHVFRALQQAPATPILVSCSLGKDRTGLICALLLELAGVHDTTIVADYLLTGRCLAPEIDRWRQDAVARGADMAVFDRQMTPQATDIRTALDHLRQRFSGVEPYLRWIGLDDVEVQQLRALLLAPTWP